MGRCPAVRSLALVVSLVPVGAVATVGSAHAAAVQPAPIGQTRTIPFSTTDATGPEGSQEAEAVRVGREDAFRQC